MRVSSLVPPLIFVRSGTRPDGVLFFFAPVGLARRSRSPCYPSPLTMCNPTSYFSAGAIVPWFSPKSSASFPLIDPVKKHSLCIPSLTFHRFLDVFFSH